MFLGVCIGDMNLGQAGWGIMIGFSVWCILLPLFIEILHRVLASSKLNLANY